MESALKSSAGHTAFRAGRVLRATYPQLVDLGAFSISLSVQDIAVSRDFYARLGFEEVGGAPDENWLIMRNGSTTIGLFQGMFEKNILTFNPGWDARGEVLEDFTDVRVLGEELSRRGIDIAGNTAETPSGPAHLALRDPDGNEILLDQHV